MGSAATTMKPFNKQRYLKPFVALVAMALQHDIRPNKVATVFAGGDIEATSRRPKERAATLRVTACHRLQSDF
jgi:hypothetical protein